MLWLLLDKASWIVCFYSNCTWFFDILYLEANCCGFLLCLVKFPLYVLMLLNFKKNRSFTLDGTTCLYVVVYLWSVSHLKQQFLNGQNQSKLFSLVLQVIIFFSRCKSFQTMEINSICVKFPLFFLWRKLAVQGIVNLWNYTVSIRYHKHGILRFTHFKNEDFDIKNIEHSEKNFKDHKLEKLLDQ